jgi:hypothetical protein
MRVRRKRAVQLPDVSGSWVFCEGRRPMQPEAGSGLSRNERRSELVGSQVALYIEGYIHRHSVLHRFASPYSFGIFSQPRDI